MDMPKLISVGYKNVCESFFLRYIGLSIIDSFIYNLGENVVLVYIDRHNGRGWLNVSIEPVSNALCDP